MSYDLQWIERWAHGPLGFNLTSLRERGERAALSVNHQSMKAGGVKSRHWTGGVKLAAQGFRAAPFFADQYEFSLDCHCCFAEFSLPQH